MWFSKLAEIKNPQRPQLTEFLHATQSFLGFVVMDEKSFAFLWEDDPELHGLAQSTFHHDVAEGTRPLEQAIEKIPDEALRQHGLLDRAMHFKIRVLNAISRQWEKVKDQFTVREWLKRVFDAIDAILDSLIDAAGGAGGLIKEFKDALSALVKTTG